MKRTSGGGFISSSGERQRHLVVPGFFDQAAELRKHYDDFFARPYDLNPRDFLWSYWYVPGQYTYLKTSAERFFPAALIRSFLERLGAWSLETLGLGAVSPPLLSFYIDGCVQHSHNDSENGRLGYVYSLTRWDERQFSGGETLLLRDDIADYWRSKEFVQANGDPWRVYHRVPPLWNQLLVFDDRVIHAVQEVRGTMDPSQARIVIHGHLSESGVWVDGKVSHQRRQRLVEQVTTALATTTAEAEHADGLLSTRVTLRPGERHGNAVVLLDSVETRDDEDALERKVVTILETIAFDPDDEEVSITVPLVFRSRVATLR